MARPRMPLDQRKSLVMTVRMRLDLSEGLAAVAFLRGTSKSGLVSQYAAEQIRVERERDQQSFDLAVKETRSRGEERERQRRRPKDASSQVDHSSDRLDCLKVTAEERILAVSEPSESVALYHSTGPVPDGDGAPTQVALTTSSLLSRPTRQSFGGPEAVGNDGNRIAGCPE